jgi:hypothetical protein
MTTMLLGVGVALFSLPSRNTPAITRGFSRSSVRLLSPRAVRNCSVALRTSPPFRMSTRKLSVQRRCRNVLVRPIV